jgi:hypothetical protein
VNLTERLALSIDRDAFRRDYHNPKLRAAQVAEKYGIAAWRLAQLARRLGVKPRREVCGNYRSPRRSRQERDLGKNGCNAGCEMWRRCNDERLDRGILPCEVHVYPDEDPALIDRAEATLHTAIDLEHFIRINLQEDRYQRSE